MTTTKWLGVLGVIATLALGACGGEATSPTAHAVESPPLAEAPPPRVTEVAAEAAPTEAAPTEAAPTEAAPTEAAPTEAAPPATATAATH